MIVDKIITSKIVKNKEIIIKFIENNINIIMKNILMLYEKNILVILQHKITDFFYYICFVNITGPGGPVTYHNKDKKLNLKFGF